MTEHLWAMVLVVFDPHRGVPAFIVLRALPFGTYSAVEAFVRTSHALRHTCQTSMMLVWDSFFGDFPLLEYQGLAETSMRAALNFFRILSWKVATEKLQPMSSRFVALGVLFDCSSARPGVLRVGNKDGRVEDICSILESILAGDTASDVDGQKSGGSSALPVVTR
eukprot:6377463-Amphidinium_carterae.1